MKDKILLFVIGMLAGAIISTGAFFLYTKSNGNNNGGPGGNPPEMQNGQGQPPEMPGGNIDNGNNQPPEMPSDSNTNTQDSSN